LFVIPRQAEGSASAVARPPSLTSLTNHVISTEAAHSLTVSRAAERPLYFAFTRSKKILEIRGAFSGAAQTRFFHHVNHTFHHNFTTKTPPQSSTFSKTPLKNSP
jgi:hypothetical protein